jgi:hypothetical protein
MRLTNALIVMGLFLWLAEPFLPSGEPAPRSKVSVCSTCGMKNTCGVVCCCCHSARSAHCPQPVAPGLYAAGCHPDGSPSSLFPNSLVRWMPPSGFKILPIFTQHKLAHMTLFPSVIFSEVPTPPPHLDFIS